MNWEQVLGGLALAIPATALGYMTYRLSRKKDAVSEQSGVASNHRAGTEQVIQGLNLLLDQAQETIKDDREIKALLEAKIKQFLADNEACRAENALYRAKYGPISA